MKYARYRHEYSCGSSVLRILLLFHLAGLDLYLGVMYTLIPLSANMIPADGLHFSPASLRLQATVLGETGLPPYDKRSRVYLLHRRYSP
jgi:hypothetical protein